jgi:exopolysaccharide biosynthesis polyprenyl glycosylphosphotransferase
MEYYAPDTKQGLAPLPDLKLIRVMPAVARRVQWWVFTLSLVIVDVFMAAVAFRLAYLFRFEIPLIVFRQDVVPIKAFYESLVGVLVVIWVIIFGVLGLYDRKNLLGGTREYALVFRGSSVGLLFVIIAGFLEPAFVIARGWILLAWLFTFFLIGLGRFTMRRTIYFLRRHGLFLSRAVIVGANKEGLSLAHQLSGWTTSGLHIIGFIDEKLPGGTSVGNHLSILGSAAHLDRIISQYSVEEVILASSAISSREKLLEIFQRYGLSSAVNVRLSSGLYEIITTGLTVDEFAYVPLVRVNKVRLTGTDVILKAMLDYLLTIPGLIVLTPLLALIAIIVRLDSPGPILHRRRVMGVNGRHFEAFKFRTMHVNGDAILDAQPELRAELNQNQKLKNDPRITRVGRFLRRTSLDELPQLLNVIRGEMSLAGPRMISPAEMGKYSQWGINLLTVKPGITGLWQVSGRSNISYEQRVRMDMYYIRNWSIWLDLQLLWQTIPAVLRGTGAY